MNLNFSVSAVVINVNELVNQESCVFLLKRMDTLIIAA